MTLSLSIRQYRWREKSQMSDNEEPTGNEQSLQYAENGGESHLLYQFSDGLFCKPACQMSSGSVEEQLYFLPVLDHTELLTRCPQWEGICHPSQLSSG